MLPASPARRSFRLALSGVLLATAFACGDDPTSPDPTDLTYATGLGIDFTRMTKLANGVWIQDVTVGTGTVATAGLILRVLYSGWLPNGTRFGVATDPNDAFEFQLGVGDVIRGWDIGVAGMRVGGTRKLVIPPSQGYGNQVNGPIPANSTLVFEVQLLSVR
jgi:FKBP-type peptidyl-prolyl cis-trans isomerase